MSYKEVAEKVASMSGYKFEYFGMHGRALPLRILFHYSGFKFEDVHVTDFQDKK